MDILKKEYQDLDKLLIPACEVELTILLGEGIAMHVPMVSSQLSS